LAINLKEITMTGLNFQQQEPQGQPAPQQEQPRVNHFEEHYIKPAEQKAPKRNDYMQKFAERFAETDARIAERGTAQDSISQKFQKGGFWNPVFGVLETMALPLDAVESAASNVMLHFQRKALSDKTKYPNLKIRSLDMDPRSVDSAGKRLEDTIQEAQTIATQFVRGLTVQQKGQFGDVYKNAGVNPHVADAAGLFLRFAGVTRVLSEAGKAFGEISKMSDKGLEKASDGLLSASEKGRQVLGQQVGAAWKPVVNEPVSKLEFLDVASKLPKTVAKSVEQYFGTSLKNMANNLTLGKFREFKQYIGGLRPSEWGRDAMGAVQKAESKQLDAVYSATKKLIEKTLTQSRGAKVSDNLMKLESAYSRVMRAQDVIQKTVKDPVLKEATKGGSAALKLIKAGDSTFRKSLNIIRKTGWEAKKEINRAVVLLESFNTQRLIANTIKKGLSAAVFGGAAGAVGGGIFRKMTSGDDMGAKSTG
jgi:hypothetical protein